MKTQPVQFENPDGATLAGAMELPQGPVRAYALFAHCFTCTKNIKAAVNICRALAAEGIGVLRFDFTGLGDSEGAFSDTNFTSNIADLIAAARFLEREYAAPQILIGHSLGGTAMLFAAHDIPSSVAVATIASPADPAHITGLFEDARDTIERAGKARVSLAGRPFEIRRQFLEDLRRHDWKSRLRDLRRALILFHSPLDTIVGIDNAAEIFLHARHPKSFVSLDKADHLLTRENDSRYVGRVLAAWAGRYLPEPDAREADVPDDAEGVGVHIGRDRYRTVIRARGHTLLADEPQDVGGANAGPTPYDYLSAALGTCTAITLRMYADNKQWPLDAATIRLTHSKIHAADCADCETRAGRVDRIERVITLQGDLDAEQKQKLLEIADKCPIHRTLESEVKVRTRLAE